MISWANTIRHSGSEHTFDIDYVLPLLLQGKLRVYLAPFLHGMRYTSFGRHFTKVEKLKEVHYPILMAKKLLLLLQQHGICFVKSVH